MSQKPFNYKDSVQTGVASNDQHPAQQNSPLQHSAPQDYPQQQPQPPAQPSPQEPTKGVQTYLTLTRYRQLSDIKLRRGKNATIGSLAAEAICDWLDRQQEGQQ